MSNARKATTKKTTTNKTAAPGRAVRSRSSARAVTAQPTLHGLLVARSFSGTVVRSLLFGILTFAVVFVGVAAATDHTTAGAFGTWFAVFAGYLLFDILYVLMAMVRPYHPRVDRVILPLALVFSLAAIYAPVIFVGSESVNIVAFWLGSGVVLICALATRLAVLLNALR